MTPVAMCCSVCCSAVCVWQCVLTCVLQCVCCSVCVAVLQCVCCSDTRSNRTRHDWLIHTYEKWPIHICGMTDAFICVAWLMTHPYVWYDWRIYMCVTLMNESYHTYERVVSHVWISHVTHMNVSRLIYIPRHEPWIDESPNISMRRWVTNYKSMSHQLWHALKSARSCPAPSRTMYVHINICIYVYIYKSIIHELWHALTSARRGPAPSRTMYIYIHIYIYICICI